MSHKINFHPEAVKNFNKSALDLLDLISETDPPSNNTDFDSEVPSSLSLNHENIVGEIKSGKVDYRGTITSINFYHNDKYYELNQDSISSFHLLCKKVKKNKNIRNKLSLGFIEANLHDWLTRMLSESNYQKPWGDFLLHEASQTIEKITAWIPIANLEIRVPIKIADVEIRSMTPELFQKWNIMLNEELEKEGRDKDPQILDSFKRKYMGRAAIVIDIEAEPELVNEIALRKAKRYTSIFSIYSGATRVPDFKSSCKVKGTENIDSFTVISKKSNTLGYSSEIIDKSSAMPWQLTTRQIRTIRKHSLDIISNLIIKEELSKFELKVLYFIELYSKAAFTNEPLEKLVFVLSSLESLLLKSGNEHIQSNLADRIAMFLGESSDEKRQIVRIIKDVYENRSGYLHHGINKFDIEKIQVFFELIWNFFSKLVNTFHLYESKIEFLEYLDNLKYA